MADTDAVTESERLVAELRAELAKREAVVRVARNARWSVPGLDDALSALDQPGQLKPIESLIARSSLGDPEASAIRAQADPAAVARVLVRADELSSQPDPAERAIVVGSVWRHVNTGHNRTVTAYGYGKTVRWTDDSGFIDLWDSALFLAQHEWVSYPPAISESPTLCGKRSPSGRMVCNEPAGHDGICSDHGDGFTGVVDQTHPDAAELAFRKVVMPVNGREIGPAWWFRQGWEMATGGDQQSEPPAR